MYSMAYGLGFGAEPRRGAGQSPAMKLLRFLVVSNLFLPHIIQLAQPYYSRHL